MSLKATAFKISGAVEVEDPKIDAKALAGEALSNFEVLFSLFPLSSRSFTRGFN